MEASMTATRSHKRGLLDRMGQALGDAPATKPELFKVAEQRLRAAAVASDVRTTAETNTPHHAHQSRPGFGFHFGQCGVSEPRGTRPRRATGSVAKLRTYVTTLRRRPGGTHRPAAKRRSRRPALRRGAAQADHTPRRRAQRRERRCGLFGQR